MEECLINPNFESDIIVFKGHNNILATHKKSLEITKDESISKRGDCIIGVSANKACSDLNERLKAKIKLGCKMRFVLIVGDSRFEFSGRGSNSLELSDDTEIVLRKSDFASPRTGAIKCSAAASEIPREIINRLNDPSCTGSLEIHSLELPDDTVVVDINWKMLER